MEAINDDLIQGLTEASQSFGCHAKWAKRLLDAYESSPKPFMKALLNHLPRIIVVFKRQAPIERLIRFVSRLAVEPTQDTALSGRMAMIIIQSLLRYQNSKNKAVRFRVCQLIGNILNRMSDDYELPETLFDRIQDVMLDRVQDKVAIVRAMACACLSRLQDPSNADDPVVTALVFALDHDISPAVRKAALVNVGVSKITLPHILLRTKDVASEVRVAAFNVCTEKVAMKALSILQRTIVLYSGLMDRDDSVRKACQETLLPVWIRQCDGNIIKLLSNLDVQEYEKECETITLFCLGPDLQPPLDLNLTFNPDQDFSPEDAFFWRIYCESLRKQKHYDIIENTFPVAVEFAQVMARYEDNVFISAQLVRIAAMMEVDEVGRSALTNLLLSWTKSDQTDVTLIKSIMDTLHRIMVRKQNGAEGESEFITNSLLLLADLRDPLEDVPTSDNEELEAEILRLEERYAQLSNDLETSKEQYLALKRKKRQKEANEKKSLIALIEEEMEQIDAELASKESIIQLKWLRLITVTSEMLERVRQTPFSSLADLLHSTILPALKHISPVIREEAIRCLCLFLLLDPETARSDSVTFVHAIRNDEPAVQVAAIRACFDILLVHDLCNDSSMDEVTKCLSECLVSDDSAVRTATGQGFAKLFANGRITDVALLSKLILFLFDPSTTNDFELRQTLSVFFPVFCQCHESHRKLLMDAWCEVLRVFMKASSSSSVRKITSQQLTPFLLYLIDRDEGDFSQLLLLVFAEWCNKSADAVVDKFLSHSISMIPVHGFLQDDAHVILYLARNLQRNLSDKVAIRNISKLISSLELKGFVLPPGFNDAQVDAVYNRLGVVREHTISESKDSDNEIESLEIVTVRNSRRNRAVLTEATENNLIDDPVEPLEHQALNAVEEIDGGREGNQLKSLRRSKDDDSIISSHSGSKRRFRSRSSSKDNNSLDSESGELDDKENAEKSFVQKTVKSQRRSTRSSKVQSEMLSKKKSPKRRRKLRISTDDSKDSHSTNSDSCRPRTRGAQTRSESASIKKLRY